MIAFLRGKILKKNKGFFILEAGDIGYKVYIGPSLYADNAVSDSLELYIHQHIREDSSGLFGFKSFEEMEMFELLLSISGVGPKSALGILSIASIEHIKESIASGDAGLLTKVSGIGRKTADRIILELKGKVESFVSGSLSDDAKGSRGDEIDALVALGYSAMQARQALNQLDSAILDSSERIRAALKFLAK